MTLLPAGPDTDEVFFFKSDIFVADVSELLVYDDGADDEED